MGARAAGRRTRADRAGGNYTVLQNGVYTACEPCKDDPRKPPLWQVTAARIIHDEGEKMLYFEDARVEFFGVPLAYVPFMSAPCGGNTGAGGVPAGLEADRSIHSWVMRTFRRPEDWSV